MQGLAAPRTQEMSFERPTLKLHDVNVLDMLAYQAGMRST